eukprot:COSAG03_NODE_18396_length_356_cov_0.591440_1_plen_94_part_01
MFVATHLRLIGHRDSLACEQGLHTEQQPRGAALRSWQCAQREHRALRRPEEQAATVGTEEARRCAWRFLCCLPTILVTGARTSALLTIGPDASG